MSEINTDLNDVFEEELDDATVITVPIDATLSNSGEAADAKAVGDALALKADADAVVNISVNGQQADNQGVILIDGTDIPMSDASGAQTIAAAVAAVNGKTGADIPLTGQEGSQTIAQAFSDNVNKTAENIQMSSSDTTTVAEAIGDLQEIADGVVLSVNGITPNNLGNVTVEEVAYARNLTADTAQATAVAFVQRMAGGTASISDGDAAMQQIRGVNVHTGIVQEVLLLDVDAPRQGGDSIEAAINRATFVSEVTGSGTYTFEYSGSAWTLDGDAVTLLDYGITVTGTPAIGDKIIVDYVQASRGQIAVATPTVFNATGWNLFDKNVDRAKVLKYAGDYIIGGAYSGIQYAQSIGASRQTITPVNGVFDIPGDGYIFVTGGDATTTYITPRQSDWTEGPDVPFAAYTRSTIDLTVLGDLFEDGMAAVGGVFDVVDFEMGMAIKKIEKLTYSDETIAALISAGRAYDADENSIYAVMDSADWETVELAATMDGIYSVSDHGIEWFDGTETGPYCMVLYGQNLKDKLVSDVLTISQQALTPEQQEQVQKNIGVTDGGIDEETVESMIKFYNSVYLKGSKEEALNAIDDAYPEVSGSGVMITFTGLSGLGKDFVGSSGTCFGFGKVRTTTFDYLAISGSSRMALGRLYRVVDGTHAKGSVTINWKNYS